MQRIKQSISILLFVCVAMACNVTKRLPDGEQLYTGAKIKVEGDTSKAQREAIETDLKTYLRPKPNSSILGIKYKLWIYQVFHTEKQKGLKHWLSTKYGEPPVLASSIDLPANTKLLTNRMENKGYFKAEAIGDTINKNKKVEAVYTVTPNVQYKIRKLVLPSDTSSIIETAMMRTSRRTLLKVNDPVDLDVIIAERERIDGALKRRGFYYFSPEYIVARVDSTVGENQVDMFIKIKDETPYQAMRKYYINNIYIYPNYDLQEDTAAANVTPEKYKDFYIIDSAHRFKPKVFDRTIHFHAGEVYNVRDHNLTLNRLVSMGTFKFVKNNFELVKDADSGKLDAYYYLTPQKPKYLRAEVTGKTNTAGFVGSELQVSWRNRNTFRGAELLTIKGNFGLDYQISGQNKGYNIFTVGGEASLVWPSIVPFNFRSASAFVPRTQLTLGYDWQKRQKLYTLNTFHGSFGYLWKESAEKEHELNLTNITYVRSSNVTQEYLDKIRDDSSLARVIEQQLIIGPSYSYTFTNTARPRVKHGFYYNGRLDLSANLLGLIQGADVKSGDTSYILNVAYSQFVKTEQDFRYYLSLSKNRINKWANRLYIGVGFPYGNSTELPFIKQFYTGGTNSLRGFRARTLGPGSYRPNVGPNDFLPDQTGDIKLEFNTELRAKLFSIVNGAIFMDVGNIWLKNDNGYKPGAKFSKDFMKELAADMGVGLRLDLSILLIRLDVAVPIRKPWLPDGERWVFDRFDFGSKDWRSENIVWNLAIGYPF